MITIASRLRPFSHLPGATCLIPGTTYVAEVFPALIRIHDFVGTPIKEIPLKVKGPVREFTVMQDLERECVTLFTEQYGFHILPNLEVISKKNPTLPTEHKERLSFGSHLKQDIETIRKRGDFREIFPIWFRLGSSIQLPPRPGDDRGIFSLLHACKVARDSFNPETIIPAFTKLYLAGLSAFFVPRGSDTDHQGILEESTSSVDSPLYLLTEGAALIRSLFFQVAGSEIAILPHMPPECFSGRMTGLKASHGLMVDLEWTKKTIRRLDLHAHKDGEIKLHFQHHVKTFRLRTLHSARGQIFNNGETLAIKSGSHYVLDRFQK